MTFPTAARIVRLRTLKWTVLSAAKFRLLRHHECPCLTDLATCLSKGVSHNCLNHKETRVSFSGSRREALRWLGAVTLATRLASAAVAAKTQDMKHRKIPSSGEDLPVIGLGTYQAFDVPESGTEFEEAKEVLRAFYSGGGRLVDSSPMYGNAEQVVGKASSELHIKDQLFLATKVWTSGKQGGIEQMGRSMQLLHRTRLDLMQIHNLLDLDTQLPTLREWKKQERFRYIGITHYTETAYPEVERVMRREAIDFLQINLSIGERAAATRLLPLAHERGIAVIANRPFGSGALFGQVRGKRLPPTAQELHCTSWAQYFLKFVLGYPAVTCVIPATRSVQHMIDNLEAGSGPFADARQQEQMVREFQQI